MTCRDDAGDGGRNGLHLSADSTYVHLYINGIYWGLYNPSERPDAAFGESYIGGDKEDWDVLNQDGVLVAEFKRLVLVPRKHPGEPTSDHGAEGNVE